MDYYKGFSVKEPCVAEYVHDLLNLEDDILKEIRQRSMLAGLPDISLGPFDGRHLEVISTAVQPKLVVEVGTLGGYSTVCLARSLRDDGILHSIEIEDSYAAVARETMIRHGFDHCVKIHVGPAIELLDDICGAAEVDLVFIDADKESYSKYLTWAEKNLRIGGVLVADNTFRKPRGGAFSEHVHAFNVMLTQSHRWRTTFLPIEDGMAVSVKVE